MARCAPSSKNAPGFAQSLMGKGNAIRVVNQRTSGWTRRGRRCYVTCSSRLAAHRAVWPVKTKMTRAPRARRESAALRAPCTRIGVTTRWNTGTGQIWLVLVIIIYRLGFSVCSWVLVFGTWYMLGDRDLPRISYQAVQKWYYLSCYCCSALHLATLPYLLNEIYRYLYNYSVYMRWRRPTFLQ